MTFRPTGALLCALGFLCASSAIVLAQSAIREGGTPNAPAAKTTTVKSSKSNTSDRMGGGGGAKAGGAALMLNPQPEPPGVAKQK